MGKTVGFTEARSPDLQETYSLVRPPKLWRAEKGFRRSQKVPGCESRVLGLLHLLESPLQSTILTHVWQPLKTDRAWAGTQSSLTDSKMSSTPFTFPPPPPPPPRNPQPARPLQQPSYQYSQSDWGRGRGYGLGVSRGDPVQTYAQGRGN